MLFSRLSIGKKEQPVGGKLDLPGLWGIAESFPLPLENLGLQMMVGGRRRRTADSQIESDAEGRLGHGGKPAGKCVLASSERSSCRRVDAKVIRANRNVAERRGECLRHPQRTAPFERLDAAIVRAARPRKILAP